MSFWCKYKTINSIMQIKNTYFFISKTYTTLNALSTIEIFIQMLKSADADKAPQHTIYKRIAARKQHSNQPNFVLQKRVKLAIKKLKKSKKNFRLTTFSPKKRRTIRGGKARF